MYYLKLYIYSICILDMILFVNKMGFKRFANNYFLFLFICYKDQIIEKKQSHMNSFYIGSHLLTDPWQFGKDPLTGSWHRKEKVGCIYEAPQSLRELFLYVFHADLFYVTRAASKSVSFCCD